MASVNTRNFYVYEHWRPDTGLPFYVGKGSGNRGFAFGKGHRGKRHQKVCKELKRFGLEVEVRKVFTYLDEEAAFTFERVQISYWRSRNINLINLTDGGEGGLSGYSFTKEQLAKKSQAMTKVWADPEFCALQSERISAALSRPETLTALSVGVKASWARLSPKQRKARSIAISVASSTAESKARRSASAKEAQNRPAVKEARRILTKELMARPEVKAKQKASLAEAFAKPEVREKRSISQKQYLASPEGHKKRCATMRDMWAVPENRVSRVETQKIVQNRPEVQQKRRASIKAAMASPEIKARHKEAVTAWWAKRKAEIQTSVVESV